jgi:hypothetical protein
MGMNNNRTNIIIFFMIFLFNFDYWGQFIEKPNY